MAYLMKVCDMFARNLDSPYGYISGWMDPHTRVLIMPNREKKTDKDADWIMYLAPVARREDDTEEVTATPEPASPPTETDTAD